MPFPLNPDPDFQHVGEPILVISLRHVEGDFILDGGERWVEHIYVHAPFRFGDGPIRCAAQAVGRAQLLGRGFTPDDFGSCGTCGAESVYIPCSVEPWVYPPDVVDRIQQAAVHQVERKVTSERPADG